MEVNLRIEVHNKNMIDLVETIMEKFQSKSRKHHTIWDRVGIAHEYRDGNS